MIEINTSNIIKAKVIEIASQCIYINIPGVVSRYRLDNEYLISKNTNGYRINSYIYLKALSVNPLKLSQKEAFGFVVD